MTDPGLSEDDELLAAELAFGLIDGAEAAAAVVRIDRDPAFAQAHARWTDYAAALPVGADIPPRPSLWPEILARLPANDDAPPAPRSGAALGPALRRWQAATALAAAAAVVLGVIATERSPLPPAPTAVTSAPVAPLVAMLGSKTDDAVVMVSYDPASGRLTAAPRGVSLGDHVPELWVIPADGKPRALGVIAAATPGWTRAPAAAVGAIAPGATLAISVEPAGGSPTGQPTGAVILTGTVSAT